MGNMFKDMSQDERLDSLESKVRRLERKLNGGNAVSKLINNLVGKDCVIDGNGFYGSKCTVADADDEWVKLIFHEKKNDVTRIVRIDSIEKITLD